MIFPKCLLITQLIGVMLNIVKLSYEDKSQKRIRPECLGPKGGM